MCGGALDGWSTKPSILEGYGMCSGRMNGALSLPFWRGTECAVAAQWTDGWSTKSSILEGHGMCGGGAVDGWMEH